MKILSRRVDYLQCLHDFIQTELGHIIGLKLKIDEASLQQITFEEMYHLFSPGDLIINRKDEVDELRQVYAVTGGRMRLLRVSPYQNASDSDGGADQSPDAGVGTWTDVVIDYFTMNWDGTRVGPVRGVYRIQHFTGEKKILDLDYYPVRFRENSEELCSQLKQRGRNVLECFGHKRYEGLSAKPIRLPFAPRPPGPPPPPMAMAGGSDAVREIESDVFVDIKTYYMRHIPGRQAFGKLSRVSPGRREVAENIVQGARDRDFHIGDNEVDEARSDSFMSSHFHLVNPRKPEHLTDTPEYLMLLPPSVPAYNFRAREWNWLDIDKLEEIDKSDEARSRGWKHLVLQKGYSELLLSIVDSHTSAYEQHPTKGSSPTNNPRAQIDLVQGKGRGLIILLHGPPGTGKTSTAETIAAYTGKPLYSITCGDIGTFPREVENNLSDHTRRAEKWGCVLLIDEADVFLAHRNWTDMTRNALVSIFLRHLEYYSGILFLTTNIVGIIDEAFKSRIHVALRYDPIDLEATERIWKNHLDRITADNEQADIKIKFDRESLLDFAHNHFQKHEATQRTWNARQIRNAFSTVIAMGQFDRMEKIRKKKLTPTEALESGQKNLTTIKLTSRNFNKIAETATDFEKYINAVRGDDVANALTNRHRDDSFGMRLSPPPKKTTSRSRPDFSQSGKRQGYLTPPLARSSKGKESARRQKRGDDEDSDEGQDAFEGRMREEVFSDDDEDEED
ncbi:P-loop containing nucleoside triphosphate hydrolase protein [Thozetella sp. PMI_491]|nr:P-loop containing nucleoside triphosphate hydrolase protein [Thozetella sp. PMI_491]